MDKPLPVKDIAIGGAVVLLAYGIADKFGLFKKDPRTDPRLPPGITAEDVDAPPTLTNQAARQIAERIYSAIYGDGTFWSGNTFENEQAVMDALIEAQNDADVLLIADVYGVREGSWSWSGPLDLPGVVLEYLEPSEIQAVNDNYADKGIQLRW